MGREEPPPVSDVTLGSHSSALNLKEDVFSSPSLCRGSSDSPFFPQTRCGRSRILTIAFGGNVPFCRIPSPPSRAAAAYLGLEDQRAGWLVVERSFKSSCRTVARQLRLDGHPRRPVGFSKERSAEADDDRRVPRSHSRVRTWVDRCHAQWRVARGEEVPADLTLHSLPHVRLPQGRLRVDRDPVMRARSQ
eukprot:52031-Hanusia_phi.AAC.1